jgi:hypothetical protein
VQENHIDWQQAVPQALSQMGCWGVQEHASRLVSLRNGMANKASACTLEMPNPVSQTLVKLAHNLTNIDH